MNFYEDHRREGRSLTWLAVILSAVLGLWLSCTASAQVPTYHGVGHQMPPPVNIVGAGFNLEYATKAKRASLVALMVGGGVTAILSTSEGTRATAAPWVAGGMTLGLSVGLNLHGLKWEERAADLWQCGYSPDALYESVPDSIGDDRPRKYQVPALIDGTKIRLPARMR